MSLKKEDYERIGQICEQINGVDETIMDFIGKVEKCYEAQDNKRVVDISILYKNYKTHSNEEYSRRFKNDYFSNENEDEKVV